jgi:hypothetical protein
MSAATDCRRSHRRDGQVISTAPAAPIRAAGITAVTGLTACYRTLTASTAANAR